MHLALSSDALFASLLTCGVLLPPSLRLMLSLSDCMRDAGPALAERALALLSPAGGSWGSAVCIASGAGLFLTAAHVIHPAAPAAAASLFRAVPSAANEPRASGLGLPHLPLGAVGRCVLHTSDGAFPARAIWVSRGPLDLALVQRDLSTRFTCRELRPLPCLSDARLSPGAPVFLAAHGLAGPLARLRSPLLSSGVIASRPEHCHFPLRCSCAVHAGASGGALVTPDGWLAGVVTSNSSLAAAGATSRPLPTLNFSVAGPALVDLCDAARGLGSSVSLSPGMAMSDSSAERALGDACAALDRAGEAASNAWALREPKAESDAQAIARLAPGSGLAAYLAAAPRSRL
jgi:hypothetical protein